MEQREIVIVGMSCGHCVAAVSDALKAIGGLVVEDVVVGLARVTGGEGVSDELLRSVVEEQGFDVSEITRAS